MIFSPPTPRLSLFPNPSPNLPKGISETAVEMQRYNPPPRPGGWLTRIDSPTETAALKRSLREADTYAQMYLELSPKQRRTGRVDDVRLVAWPISTAVAESSSAALMPISRRP